MPKRPQPSTCVVWALRGLCLGVLTVAVSAQGDAGISDRLEIAEVVAQYSYRWDSKDSQGFADLFAEDGVMERWVEGVLVPNSRVEGRQAIFEYAKRSHEGRLADRQTRDHMSALTFLELKATSAITENMALITHQTAGEPPFISASGIYRNTWRKTAQGWKISNRALYNDRLGSHDPAQGPSL